MRKIASFFILLFSFCILSCASVSKEENIFVFAAENGQMNFIRPTKISSSNTEITSLDIDLTYTYNQKKLQGDPSVNYTLSFAPEGYDLVDTAKVYLLYKDEKIEFRNSQVIFKDLDSKKILNIRYSSSISKNQFEIILLGNENCTFVIESKDLKLQLNSEEFNKKIWEARVLY